MTSIIKLDYESLYYRNNGVRHPWVRWPSAWFFRGLSSIFEVCPLSSESFNLSSIFRNGPLFLWKCPLFLKIRPFAQDKMDSSAEPKKPLFFQKNIWSPYPCEYPDVFKEFSNSFFKKTLLMIFQSFVWFLARLA